jgi:ribonucleoside-diphosphate reductase alpha chain
MQGPRPLHPAGLEALPAQPLCQDVLQKKYLQPDEHSTQELFVRVAHALASVEPPAWRADMAARFLDNLRAGAIGAGRIMSTAGTGKPATLINCFVQPIGDCIQGRDEAGYPGLHEALREATETLRRGGGVGYDFSRIRPEGARERTPASTAAGPCLVIDLLDQACAALENTGARRGAQMGVLRIDHPDVLAFITAKRTPGRWRHFNVSVAVTDDFMQAVTQEKPWPLVHRVQPGAARLAQGALLREDGQWVYRTVPARELWDTVMRSAYDFAEPGILFLDRMAQDNNLRALETLSATNPCGEQPLPPYGCCALGPLILTSFVRHPFHVGGRARFDVDAFKRSAALQVRLLDNVLDLTLWPLPQHRLEAHAKRRIGVGFTGLGDALVMLGLRYDRAEGRSMAARIAEHLRDAVYAASIELAQARGAFPLFDAHTYLAEGTFASRLPAALKQAIRTHGIRNSHLLSVAPTGTVSLAFADNVSNGIEPAFAWTYTRHQRQADGSLRHREVQDHAWRVYQALDGDTSNMPPSFVSALSMRAQDHVAMMQAVQPFIDAAISKTVNVPADCAYEDFKGLYMQAWHAGLKGLATYRPNAIVGAVMEAAPAPQPDARLPRS